MADRNTDKQPRKLDWLKEYQWQKGQSGNPKGRPKGKTLKEWVKDFLMNMSEEARMEFMKMIDPDTIWKMAEGNPHNTGDITSAGKPIPILNLDLKQNEIHKDNGDKEDTKANKES